MTGTESGEVHIAGSPEKVWRTLTDLGGITSWYEDWDRCDHDASEVTMHVGTRFRLSSNSLLRRSVGCHVVTADAPTVLRWIEQRPLTVPLLVEFRLQARADATVVIHSKTPGSLRRQNRQK